VRRFTAGVMLLAVTGKPDWSVVRVVGEAIGGHDLLKAPRPRVRRRARLGFLLWISLRLKCVLGYRSLSGR
jgi:hypothetical protein